MPRKTTNVFSLAFLDVMSCGFGAIILFFMIINADTVKRKHKVSQDLQGEVTKLDVEVTQGKEYLVELKNSIKQSEEIIEQTQGLSKRVITEINHKREELTELQQNTFAKIEHINKLKADIAALEKANKALEGGAQETESQGDRLIHFAGEGQRQYITGLQIGGKHLVILVDSSASMLADRIVNVIRNRNLPDRDKLRAAKWQQVVRTVEWISTRIPPQSKFKIIAFNESVRSLGKDIKNEWLDGGDPAHLRLAINDMRNLIPGKGTSLYRAFNYINQLNPKPDSVYLLTDGLPTQGSSKPTYHSVSAKQRIRHFNDSLRKLPDAATVNIILFPMEGDPFAASAFWLLAAQTRGAFFSPSKDWP